MTLFIVLVEADFCNLSAFGEIRAVPLKVIAVGSTDIRNMSSVASSNVSVSAMGGAGAILPDG